MKFIKLTSDEGDPIYVEPSCVKVLKISEYNKFCACAIVIGSHPDGEINVVEDIEQVRSMIEDKLMPVKDSIPIKNDSFQPFPPHKDIDQDHVHAHHTIEEHLPVKEIQILNKGLHWKVSCHMPIHIAGYEGFLIADYWPTTENWRLFNAVKGKGLDNFILKFNRQLDFYKG